MLHLQREWQRRKQRLARWRRKPQLQPLLPLITVEQVVTLQPQQERLRPKQQLVQQLR